MKETNGNSTACGSKTMYMVSFLIGLAAALTVVVFYLGQHTLTSDWTNAKMQLEDNKWWIIALSFGLGVQAGLYSLLKKRIQGNPKGAKSSLAASSGISAASMAACCTHYLAAFLPVLGLSFLSTAASGLAKYQSEFFLLGVFFNLFGIGVMLRLTGRIEAM